MESSHPIPRTAERPRRAWRRWTAALVAVAAILGILAAPPAAAQTARPARLTAQDRAEITRIETYLNGIATLEARFLQATSTGEVSEGRLFIHRPGRLRIAYDPPVPVLIVANRGWLTYYDKQLEQVSHVLLDSTPAGLLVSEKISLFSKDLIITDFAHESEALRLTLVRASDPLEGSLTLVLADKPMELKKWLVTDAQGVTTTVSLLATRFGVTLDPKLFEFEDPNLFAPRQD